MKKALLFGFFLASLMFPPESHGGSGPLHGRPRYEKVNGKEWIFFVTDGGTDWYLAPRGDLRGSQFTISIRGVSPGVDNFGPVTLNCGQNSISWYYEKFTPVQYPVEKSLYKKFCN